jgi:addiction module HigA family antidote
MPMKSPPHPGIGFRDDIEALGLTVAQAADGLGVTRQQLYRELRGESGITPEMAIRLEKAIGSTADAWLRQQTAYDLANVRAREGTIKVKMTRRLDTPRPAKSPQSKNGEGVS